MEDIAIDIRNLTKSYGSVTALDAVSFGVRRSELFGLIGPDGAGKTTLFRLLATLLVPDSGGATLDGLDIATESRRIRECVGYMPGRFSLYSDLTVEENLRFFASLFGVRAEEHRELYDPIYRQLERFRRRRAGRLSGGMKQKLALCCALVHRPSFLFLDEPTTGVDAVSRSEFWEILDSLKRLGITILVSTPYMDEARRCDRIALLDGGLLLAVDTPRHLVSAFGRPLYALSGERMYRLLLEVRRRPDVEACYPFGSVHHLIPGPGFSPDRFLTETARAGFGGVELRPAEPGIEDVFIRSMRHE